MINIPCLTLDWADAPVIVDPSDVPARPGEDGSISYVNDFCLTQDRLGRWHCIGIVGDRGNNDLFHAVAPSLEGPFHFQPRIGSGQPGFGTYNMWAPFAAWENDDRALLFYGHMNKLAAPGECDASLRALASSGSLETWKPYPDIHSNILFAEPHVRDPQILRDLATDEYLLFYVVGDGWTSPESNNVVRVRRSKDMLNWSEARTVLGCPPGYRASESIFVLQRDGLYYLWVCGFDYGRMSLYASDDPFCFGDAVENRLLEMPGHAPEIVAIDGEYWMACVSVASSVGNPPGWNDLPGVRIQKLEWKMMSAELEPRVYRRG